MTRNMVPHNLKGLDGGGGGGDDDGGGGDIPMIQ